MGRPLNSKFFGPDAGADGFQFKGTGWFAGELAAEPCYIVKQKSNRRFVVHGETSGKEEVCFMVQGAPVAAGQFQIIVTPADGVGGVLAAESAKIITGRKVKTYEGNAYIWSDLTQEAATEEVGDADVGTDDQPDDDADVIIV